MFILPTISVELVYSTTISSIRFIGVTEQCLILLSYLINVVLKERALYIIQMSMSWSCWHLNERSLLTLYVLGSLEIINPPKRNYSIDCLLIFQINILMLINSSTTPAVHHYLLLLVDRVATFPTWQIVFSRYRIKVNSRNL